MSSIDALFPDPMDCYFALFQDSVYIHDKQINYIFTENGEFVRRKRVEIINEPPRGKPRGILSVALVRAEARSRGSCGPPVHTLPRASEFFGLIPNFCNRCFIQPEQSSGVLNQTFE
jgi:hypothetical protein